MGNSLYRCVAQQVELRSVEVHRSIAAIMLLCSQELLPRLLIIGMHVLSHQGNLVCDTGRCYELPHTGADRGLWDFIALIDGLMYILYRGCVGGVGVLVGCACELVSAGCGKFCLLDCSLAQVNKLQHAVGLQ